ncbi:MAG TPA: cupredoxin family copper-binding protein [Methylovirgula sp.]
MAMFFKRRGVIAAALLVLWSFAPAAATGADEVTFDNFAFTPQILQVKAGTTVTFVNHDDIPHSVVSETGAFRSRALDTDEKYTFTFAKAGEFAYFCGLHPFMKGKVVVVP